MKVLITGTNGFLGQHLTLYLINKGFQVIAASRGACRLITDAPFIYEEIDITNEKAFIELVKTHQPQVIVHNAAMSKPDECHNKPTECVLNNIVATQNVIQAATLVNSYLLYVSTDFVFGENGPHIEDAPTSPLNVYGNSKLIAERLVEASGLKTAIMRPVLMYGPLLQGMKPTFIHWVMNNILEKKKIKVVNDQWRTPTYVYDVCEGIYRMIVQQFEGILHLAGKNILTPYEMAVSIANTIQADDSYIEKVTSETFVEKVRRAKRSGLTIQKAINAIDYSPVSFEEGIRLSLL